jgi:hypothetical protein
MWSFSFAGSTRSRTSPIDLGIGEGDALGAPVAVGLGLEATPGSEGAEDAPPP